MIFKKVMLFILLLFLIFLSSDIYEGNENEINHQHSELLCTNDDDCNGNGICDNERCICDTGYSHESNCSDIVKPSWWSKTNWDRISSSDKEYINVILNRYQPRNSTSLTDENSEVNMRNSMCPDGSYLISDCMDDITRYSSQGFNGTDTVNVPRQNGTQQRLREIERITLNNSNMLQERRDFVRNLFNPNYGKCSATSKCINEEFLSSWTVIAKFYIANIGNIDNSNNNCPSYKEIKSALNTLKKNIPDFTVMEHSKNWIVYKDNIFDRLDQELIDIYNQWHEQNQSENQMDYEHQVKLQNILNIEESEANDNVICKGD